MATETEIDRGCNEWLNDNGHRATEASRQHGPGRLPGKIRREQDVAKELLGHSCSLTLHSEPPTEILVKPKRL